MNADVRTCKYCGKLYRYIGNALCPDCVQNMHDAERKVRNYLYDNVGADISDISEGTGLDERTVLYLLKEGILTATASAVASQELRCDMCKKPISSGRICNGCRTSLGNSLNSVLPGNAPARRPSSRRQTDDVLQKKKGMHLEFR